MKAKWITCVLASISFLAAHAQECRATAVRDGKTVLHKTLRTRLLPNGQMLFTDISVDATGKDGTIETNLLYSANGRPIRTTAHLVAPRVSGTMTLNYGLIGATLKGTFGSQTKTTTLSYPKDVSIVDISNFWFIRDHPKPGATCTYMQFEMGRMRFVKLTDIYVGDRSLIVHGRKVIAHLVTNEYAKHWVDDHWLPYRDELSDGTVITRD